MKQVLMIVVLFIGLIFVILKLSDVLNTPAGIVLAVIYAFVLYYLKEKYDKK